MPDSNSRTHLRRDGDLFDQSYLTSANRDVATDYLWPLPIFERFRHDMCVSIGTSNPVEVRPGDVLEYCGTAYEEYLLVVAVLPVPAAQTEATTIESSSRLLLYSSNAETFRVFDATHCSTTPGDTTRVTHPTGEYVVHPDAAESIPVGSSLPADVTYPPLPRTSKDEPSERTKHGYPHAHPPRSIQPARGYAHDTDSIDEFVYTVQQGDAREVLQSLPSNSVHGWITSPPYYQQRDYDAEGQLGREASIDSYLENLVSVVNQLMRVMRDDGLGWLVVADSYDDGALDGIPERLHDELETEGYAIVHHSPWVKSNPKPDPAPNRYSQAHERILCIAHDTASYYFNKEAADTPQDVFETAVGQTDTSHDAVFPLELPKRIITTTIPDTVCMTCGAPYEPVYEVTDIRNLPSDRPQAQQALQKAERHGLSDDHLWALRAVGLGQTGQAKRTQDGTGHNRDEIQALADEAAEALGAYAREFTQPQKDQTGVDATCDCDTAETTTGIVLDPFAGSGTTCLAAKQLQRRWIGIELNPEYRAHAEERLQLSVSDPEYVTDSDEQTLDQFIDD